MTRRRKNDGTATSRRHRVRGTALGAAVAREVVRAPVRAVRAPARAAVTVGHYWRAERHTLRQGFAALSICSAGDLTAGLALGAMTGRLEQIPGLLVLLPAVIGMRGNIFGAMGSRLGTSIQAGLFSVTAKREGVLYQNAFAATLLSIVTSAYLAVGARVATAALGLPSAPLLDFMAIAVIAGAASGAMLLLLTILLARTAHRRSWDLDSVAAPVVTFIGDTITVPALFAASFLADDQSVSRIAGALALGVAVVCLVVAVRNRLPIARRIFRESAATLMIAGLVSLFAGIIIEHQRAIFLEHKALLVLIPSFLADAGALGGILSARLTSKLHLGAVAPRIWPQRLALLDISLAAPFALMVFTLVGVSSHFVASAFSLSSPGLGDMVMLSLVAGFMVTLVSAFIAYLSAIATYRFGLDPDNHGIPIVTSTIDVTGMLCLIAVILWLKVG